MTASIGLLASSPERAFVGDVRRIVTAVDVGVAVGATAGERVGFQAASLLHELMQGKSHPSKVIYVEPGSLIVRQSSDVLAVGDPVVAEAVRYVRENIPRNLSVKDVMREVPVGRR